MSVYSHYIALFKEEHTQKLPLQYSDIEELVPTLFQLTLDHLSNRNSLYISVDKEIHENLLKTLHKYNFPFLNGDAYNLSDVVQHTDIDQSFIDRLIQYKQWHQEWHLPCFGNLSLYDISKIYSDSRSIITPYPFWVQYANFEYSNEEYHGLTQAIEAYSEYTSYYTQDALWANITSRYNEDVILYMDHDVLMREIKDYTSQILDLQGRLISSMKVIEDKLITDQREQLLNELAQSDNTLNTIRSFIAKYGDEPIAKPGLLSFDKHKKERFTVWNSMVNTPNEYEGPLDFYDFIFLNKNEIAYKVTRLRTKVQEEIKGITLLNSNIDELSRINSQLHSWINNINRLGIFKNVIEHNSQNIGKTYDFMQQIIEELQILLQHRRIRSIIKWNEISKSCPSGFVRLLDQFKSIPIGEWKDQFNVLYFGRLIENKLTKFSNIQDISAATYNANKYALLGQITKRWRDVADSAIDNIKKTNSTLYTDIFKKQNKTISALLQPEVAFPKPPIIIYNHRKLEEDHIILDRNTIRWSYDTSERVLPIHVIPNVSENIANTPITDQLRIAKQFTYALYPFLKEAIGFQHKSGNFIVNIDSYWSEEIKSHLESLGAKRFLLDTKDHVTDFLLSYQRDTYIFTLDGLLANKKDTCGTQLALKEQITKFGIKIINFDTYDLIQNDCLITNILQKIPNESKQHYGAH